MEVIESALIELQRNAAQLFAEVIAGGLIRVGIMESVRVELVNREEGQRDKAAPHDGRAAEVSICGKLGPLPGPAGRKPTENLPTRELSHSYFS